MALVTLRRCLILTGGCRQTESIAFARGDLTWPEQRAGLQGNRLLQKGKKKNPKNTTQKTFQKPSQTKEEEDPSVNLQQRKNQPREFFEGSGGSKIHD